jgi:hypothetical protein
MSAVLSSKIGKLFFLLFFLFFLGRHGSVLCSSSDIERAKQSFDSYVNALKYESGEEAKSFWNKAETKRYETYDWQWSYLAFRKLDPLDLSYRIITAEDKEGYVILEVEWYYRKEEDGYLQKDLRYFIEEDGRMVGANPIFVQTRDWLKKESEHFVYHYQDKQDEPTDELLEQMDKFYKRMIELLQVNFKGKIDYYRCNSAEEVGLLFNAEPSLARSQPVNRVVASVQKFVPHEIVHIISYAILPPNEEKTPPEYLSEGLAYYLGGASFFSPELLLSWAKRKIETDKDIRLDSIINNPWLYGNNVGAGLIGSFAKFLIETEGIAKFKQVFAAGETLDEQKETLEKNYGQSLDRLQEKWKGFVSTLPLPTVRVGDLTKGKSLFHMDDPNGDDKGDGDYLYPKNENILPGSFDLTRFEVSLDEELVYFQLEFANLSQVRISSDEGLNGTFAAIAMDTDNQENNGSTKLFMDNGNFEFSKRDGYEFAIEVSNAGVLLYDQNWVWQLLFLRAFSPESHIKEKEISFGIPRRIIGTPDSSWKFQVLTGGQRGGYKNTAYGVGKFMQVGEQSTQEQGGGGTNTDFNPDVYDILAPKGGDQIRILGSYDVERRRKAVIPMIGVNQR